jgi:hypothetical protein
VKGGQISADQVNDLRDLLTYNAHGAVYFALLAIGGEWVGLFLWPAVVLHAILAVLLARTFRDKKAS